VVFSLLCLQDCPLSCFLIEKALSLNDINLVSMVGTLKLGCFAENFRAPGPGKNGNSKEKIKKGNLQYYWLLTVQKSGKLTSWGWEFIYHYLRWVFVASQVGFLAGFLNRQQYLLSLLKWICWVADIWMATGGSHKVVVVESYEWTNTCEACAMKLLKFFFIIDDMACGKCVGIAIGFSTLRSFIR